MPSYKASQGEVLWKPSQTTRENANLSAYIKWLKSEKGLDFEGYHDLWHWSANQVEEFWASLWQYFELLHSQPYDRVLNQRVMPGARWFLGAEINYAQQVFSQANDKRPAFLFQSEACELSQMSWAELRDSVAAVAAFLRRVGVESGDRVAAFIPNTPEALIGFLACASLGAVWSSCSPDFAGRSVLDRFSQIEPKVLLAIDGYVYGGKAFDTKETVAQLKSQLPTVEQVVVVPSRDHDFGGESMPGITPWSRVLEEKGELIFEQVPFNHPMWVVYSSGTTGRPKGLVHSQGGIMLEFMKFHTFHLDLHPGDSFFWFSTTGWVMWNIVAGSLLVGAVPVLFDGNPAYPDLTTLWRMAEKAKLKFFGTSAAFIGACMQAGLRPAEQFGLGSLKAMGSTGSPLSPEGFKWVYQEVGQDLILGSTSGGTDICSGFLGACPLLPVRAGELQCRCLGVKAEAWDENGQALVDQVGELVISQPMPSMPIHLWQDEGDQRYLESYFQVYPGAWCHGDWVKITAQGGAVILGRSDSTLNRQGVRMGSSDFYRVLDDMEEVADSLILGYTDTGGEYHMPLFVVLAPGLALDDGLKKKINSTLRGALSPRHVPDGIFAIGQVPTTLNGKKMEVPIIKILSGIATEKAINVDSMSNPESINYFLKFAQEPPW
ncbi:MAG: acetoacetate--CoA ligase [Proteobacteria bacterium]|nr:acetoacetate--CoA ligase [Pseudomonadota bacterium]MBU2469195.1 acetoacetate--CoA ligase [Pseudomonadota bacterium]MBU2518697.1 acetoacetate--CoA ligase [Pseudomonadota bacterium]